jgi:hypothetical protein
LALTIALTCGALLVLGACAALDDTPRRGDTVNAVLGDASYRARFGQAPDADADEVTRIQTHLAFVEALLRGSDTATLTPAQRAARQAALDHLARYREAAAFPTNEVLADRRLPVFIDAHGAICAVGYLVEQSAGRDAAEAIAAVHRYDYVEDMTLPLVDEWAAANGFTRRELAMIQPTYDFPEPPIEPPIVPGPPPPHPPGVPPVLPPRPPLPPVEPVPPPVVRPTPPPSEPSVMEIGRMLDKASFASVRASFRDVGEELGGCWGEGDPNRTVTLRFEIRPDGESESVTVTGSRPTDERLARCVAEVVEGMRFERFAGLHPQAVTYRLDHATSLTGWPAERP